MRILACLILLIVDLGLAFDESFENEIESERIVGGAAASKNMFPWMVALYYRDAFVCTASIISKRDVLTAAHCVVFNNVVQRPEDYYGIIGSVSKNKDGKRVTFSKITPHPDNDQLLNDIAVLTTTEEITFDDSVQSICLATTKVGCVVLKPVLAMGWGITSRNTSVTATPDILQYTKLRVYPNTKCSVLFFNKVPKTIMCAGALGTGVCAGDSGGPLVFRTDKNKNTNVQVGVASFVNTIFGCARLLGPAGFTKVSAYNDFLRNSAEGELCFI